MRKTIFTLGLMLAAALSLTNCSKNEEVDFTPAPENTFELYANVESRTINDGMTTKWAAGDQINVFHAVAGTTAYVNDTPYDEVAKEGNPFVTDASGLFKGSLAETLDQTKSYDWYAIYPYSGYITTPANKTAGFVYIGGRSDTPQVQNGNNSTAHIAGKNYPLVGVAKAVPASDKPAITMSHISSLIEYNIKNELAEDITVTSIEFSTVEDVVGTYYIDFTGETIKYTTGDHISQTAVLTVNNGQAIKNGDNATFYMAIRPFSIDDDDITIKVNAKTATGVGTYTKTLATVTEFHAGQMKTINIGFNAKIEVSSDMTATIDFSTKDQRTSLSTTEQVWSNAGITLTNSKGSSTSDIADYSNPARFYKSSKIEVVSAVGNMTKIAFVCNTAAYATSLNKSIAGSTVSGSTVTVTFAEPTNSFSCSMTDGQVRMNSLTVTYTPADANAPFIGLEKTSFDVDAAATSEEVAVTLKNINESDVTVDSDATWVVADLAEGVLTLNIAENTDTAARTATVTISASDISETITINQKGAATLETVTIAQFLTKSESTTAWYQLTGMIISIDNTTYGNLTIKDDSGEVYVYGLKKNETAGNQTFAELGLKAGDTVTLIGNRGAHNGTPQVTNAYYVKHEVGEPLEVVITPVTIAEFLAKPVSTSALYQLTGTITNIKNTTYGNFDIQDETGTVYVYGLKENATAGNQTFSNLGLKVGDVVTLVGNRAVYNGSPQVGNAYYVSHTSSTTPEPEPEPDPTPDPEVPTDGQYTLLKNVSELTVGDHIVIAAKDYNYALSTNQKSNNRGQAAITKSGEIITFDSDVQILTVKEGMVAGTFAFYTGSGYLYAASTSKNYLKTESALTANSSWAISIATDGTATIEAQGSNTKNVMQYNQQSSLFACYGSASQKPIVIYRLK